MYAKDVLKFLEEQGFELFVDHWNEQKLYFGNHGKEIMEIDKIFGSERHKLGLDLAQLDSSAKLILSNPVNPETFNQKEFLKSFTDVIAIKKHLSAKMRQRWI